MHKRYMATLAGAVTLALTTSCTTVEQGGTGGTITGSATLRLTGESTKITASELTMNGGTIVNEGTWSNTLNGSINLDYLTGGGAGTLVNKGTWNFNASATYSNTYGGGVVENLGLMHAVAGNSRIYGAMNHRTGSTFRCSAGWLLFQGGGLMEPGATLDANGGDLYFQGGTHQLQGGSITGEHGIGLAVGGGQDAARTQARARSAPWGSG